MSSPHQIETLNRVWKDKLEIFFTQAHDHPYDSFKNNEAADTPQGVVTARRKNSKFLKFFKPEDTSENERASASTGDNSSGDFEDDFRKKCFVNEVCLGQKIKITNILRNGWDVAIKKQKSLNLRYILPHAGAIASKRVNIKMPSVTRNYIFKNSNGNCIY